MTSESHARAGTVMAVWYGGVVNYADTSTADIGDTSEVTLSVALSGNNVNLQASGSINNWSIKTTSKLI